MPTLYKSEYKKEFIEEIINEIKTSGKFKEGYIYFNNTWGTGAIANAKQMQKYLKQ